MSRELYATDIRARSRIEKEQIMDELEEESHIANKQKAMRVQKIKEDRAASQARIERDRRFGLAFASVSRHLGNVAEKSRAKDVAAERLRAAADIVGEMRKSGIESRYQLKVRTFEADQQKHRIARLDQVILDQKRAMCDAQHDDRLRLIHEEKRKAIERSKLARHDRKMALIPVYPDVLPQPKEDIVQGAVKEVRRSLGANLGESESLVLVDVLNDILSSI
jgi:hypothetical protein